MRSTVVLSIVLAMCVMAGAQPAATPPQPAATPQLPAPVTAQPDITARVPPPRPGVQPVGERRSVATALLLSLGGTAASWVVFVEAAKMHSGASWTLGSIGALGMLTAPSFGHWYGGSHDLRKLGMRALGVALLAADAYACRGDEEAAACTMPGVLAFAALFVGGTIYSIATAPRAVRLHNTSLGVTVAPMVGGGRGLVVGGRF